jgi:hypothetical protein
MASRMKCIHEALKALRFSRQATPFTVTSVTPPVYRMRTVVRPHLGSIASRRLSGAATGPGRCVASSSPPSCSRRSSPLWFVVKAKHVPNKRRAVVMTKDC